MRATLVKVAVLIVLVAAIGVAVLYREQFNAAALEQWVADAGVAGPLVFMAIYAIGTVLFLPGSVLTLAGGALFGPLWGTLYNLTGATIGATIAFLIARYLAASWVENKAGGRTKQLIQGVEAEGWRFIAFVRLVPLFPFNILNYALGLTRIKLTHYVIASYLCMLPGAFAYTYLGYAARQAASGDTDTNQIIQLGIIATAILAVVAYIPRIVAKLRRGPTKTIAELKEILVDYSDTLLLDVRSEAEFNGELGHIEQAINIPVNELKDRYVEIESQQEKPLLIICHTDQRSHKAATLLASKGFADVHVVAGGMKAWRCV